MMRPELPGQVGSFKLSVPIAVGFLASLVTGGLTIAFQISNEETRKTLSFLSTCIGASVALTAAFYIGESVKVNAQEKKIDRTLIYITRWSDPAFDPNRKAVYLVNEAIKEAKVKIPHLSEADVLKHINQKLESNLTLRISVHNALNFLEEIAICIEEDVIDEKLLYCFYRSIVVTYCRTFDVWIQQLRAEKRNPKLFRALTDLSVRWNSYPDLYKI